MAKKKMLLDTNYVIDLAELMKKNNKTKEPYIPIADINLKLNDDRNRIINHIEKQFNDKQLLAISETRNSNYVDFKAFNDMYNDMLKCKRLTPEERIKVVGYKIENYKQYMSFCTKSINNELLTLKNKPRDVLKNKDILKMSMLVTKSRQFNETSKYFDVLSKDFYNSALNYSVATTFDLGNTKDAPLEYVVSEEGNREIFSHIFGTQEYDEVASRFKKEGKDITKFKTFDGDHIKHVLKSCTLIKLSPEAKKIYNMAKDVLEYYCHNTEKKVKNIEHEVVVKDKNEFESKSEEEKKKILSKSPISLNKNALGFQGDLGMVVFSGLFVGNMLSNNAKDVSGKGIDLPLGEKKKMYNKFVDRNPTKTDSRRLSNKVSTKEAIDPETLLYVCTKNFIEEMEDARLNQGLEKARDVMKLFHSQPISSIKPQDLYDMLQQLPVFILTNFELVKVEPTRKNIHEKEYDSVYELRLKSEYAQQQTQQGTRVGPTQQGTLKQSVKPNTGLDKGR
ncbi:MAG TPA: hypothetical protein DD621_03685 [Clostridiales bacterium]|nr:hypothetical protein [Clostridiales bacterium]